MPKRPTPMPDVTPRERKPDVMTLLPVLELQPNPHNPRRKFDPARDAELVASVREKGVLEPLIVRQLTTAPTVAGPSYQVIAGGRRLAAALAAGLDVVPCIVKDLNDAEALEVALIENAQRVDIHPLDEAEAYAALQKLDKRVYTVAAIARRTGQTESHVYRRLRLLDLSKKLKTALAEDRLSIGHAEKLMRLSAELQETAIDDGVVWRRLALLDDDEDGLPTRDDLAPLADLEEFIRTKSHFDPTSEDTRHFQPELAADIDQVLTSDAATDGEDTEGSVERDVEEARASLLELSEDPLCRVKIGASKTDKIPLTPSKWREIKTRKDECEYSQRGVIVHGGPARILEVCVTRRCQKHWPVANKKARTSGSSSTTRESSKPSWQIEDEKRKAAEEAWKPLWARVKPALVAHAAKFKLTASLVLQCARGDDLSSWSFQRVAQEFGVKFTDKTIAQVFVLTCFIACETRDQFLRDAKPWKFNLGPIEQKYAAEQKKAEAKGPAPATAKKTRKAKKTAA